MALNIKSGPGLSLHQVNIVGVAVSGQDVDKGQVVRLTESGGVLSVYKGSSASTAMDDLLGFALNSQADGDVIESGKIGVFVLDGASILETTYTADTINYTNYPLGTQLTAKTDGTVDVANGTTDRVIGNVAGIRDLPAVQTVGDKKIQGKATFLAIKLNS